MIKQTKPTQAAIVTGKLIDIADPDYKYLTLEMLSTGLANANRYGGQLPQLYSVAQHSLIVLELTIGLCFLNDIPEEEKPQQCLAALLHDAPECILGDPIRPMQMASPKLAEGWKELAVKFHKGFAFNFGLNKPYTSAGYPIVKQADVMAMELERRAFFPNIDCWIPDDDVKKLNGILVSRNSTEYPNMLDPLWQMVAAEYTPRYVANLFASHVSYFRQHAADQKPN